MRACLKKLIYLSHIWSILSHVPRGWQSPSAIDIHFSCRSSILPASAIRHTILLLSWVLSQHLNLKFLPTCGWQRYVVKSVRGMIFSASGDKRFYKNILLTLNFFQLVLNQNTSLIRKDFGTQRIRSFIFNQKVWE